MNITYCVFRRRRKGRYAVSILASIFALVFFLAAIPEGVAAIRYVAPDGSNQFPFNSWATAANNVREAVAGANAGDLVLVTNGVYDDASTIVITNAITVRSVNGPSATILDHMNYAGRVMFVDAPGAIVEGFTIQGGAFHSGGGVYLGPGASLHASMVVSNRGVNGSGIYAGPGSVVSGCVVRANYVYTGGGYRGGGIYCVTGTVQDCLIEGNSAYFGGGVYNVGGMIERCIIQTNSAYWGGGVEGFGGGILFEGGGTADHCRVEGNVSFGTYKYGGGVHFQNGGVLLNSLVIRNTGAYGGGLYAQGGGQIDNCTIAGNSVDSFGFGGGVFCVGGSMLNSIVSGNTGGSYPDVYDAGGSYLHCCSSVYLPGTANIMADPLFIYPPDGNYRLGPLSPCRNSGMNQPWMTGARDLDGRDRILEGVVDLGAYEIPAFSCNFAGTPQVGTVPLRVVFTGEVSGAASGINFQWDFDGDDQSDLTGENLMVVTQVYLSAGRFSVRLCISNTTSGTTALVAKANYIGVYPSEVFVSPGGSHTPPFTTWETAATNIQAAAYLGFAGTVVWVTNGTYGLSSMITVPQGVVIQSVNGAGVTIVDGNNGSWRCFNLSSSGGVLRGFTVMRGYAGGSGAGGIYAGPYTRVHDCVITNNKATTRVGGIELGYDAIVSNCVITGNWVGDIEGGGGVYNSGGLVEDSIISDNLTTSPYGGAGAWCVNGARLRRCVVTRNRSGLSTGWQQAAGIWAQGSFIEDCEVSFNTAPAYYAGGGIMCYAGSIVSGCTVTANSGYECGGIYVNGGVVLNSLVEHNTGSTYKAGGIYLKSGRVEHCIIRNNYALNAGGGVSIRGGVVRNCLIVDNSAGKDQFGSGGGGVYVDGGGTLESCTISRNSAHSGGGIHCFASSTLDVRNSIVYGNTAEVWDNCFIGTGAMFSAVCSVPLLSGPGNLDGDPAFASPHTGDFRLLPGSPCIDGGMNDVWMETARDLEGLDRIADGLVDLGAYEAVSGPLIGNAIADVTDGTGPRHVVFEAFADGTNTANLFYSWDFNGDGTAELTGYGLRIVTNLYNEFGRFNVALTVSNAGGDCTPY